MEIESERETTRDGGNKCDTTSQLQKFLELTYFGVMEVWESVGVTAARFPVRGRGPRYSVVSGVGANTWPTAWGNFNLSYHPFELL